MAEQKVRISELPPCTDIDGLVTIGVNNRNESVKVPLDSVLNAINGKASVIHFKGFVNKLDSAVNKVSVSLKSTDANVQIVYNRRTNCFILKQSSAFYNNFIDGDKFGTIHESGRKPYAWLYQDDKTGEMYFYNGTDLQPLLTKVIDLSQVDVATNGNSYTTPNGDFAIVKDGNLIVGVLLTTVYQVAESNFSYNQSFWGNRRSSNGRTLDVVDVDNIYMYQRTAVAEDVTFEPNFGNWKLVGGNTVADSIAEVVENLDGFKSSGIFYHNLLINSDGDPGDCNNGGWHRHYQTSTPIVNNSVYTALIDVTTVEANTQVSICPYGYERAFNVIVAEAGRHLLKFDNMLYHIDSYPPSCRYCVVAFNKNKSDCVCHKVMLVKGDVNLETWQPSPEDIKAAAVAEVTAMLRTKGILTD